MEMNTNTNGHLSHHNTNLSEFIRQLDDAGPGRLTLRGAVSPQHFVVMPRRPVITLTIHNSGQPLLTL